MTLLLAVRASGGNWSPAAWAKRFRAELGGRAVAVDGVDDFDPATVRYVAAWKPEPGLIGRCANVAVIFNLGAGVDALLADPTLPAGVAIVRAVDADLSNRMTEYVVWQVLDQHRQGPLLRAAQARGEWAGPVQAAAKDVRVGLMGLGQVARGAAEVLVALGFEVGGWSRSPATVAGVRCHHGRDGLAAFLAATDILVVLLPLTAETRHIIDAGLIGGLARDGRLGGPVLINAGRGGLQVERDILAALDDGTLGHAVLDVFETEPLPAASALWRHPRVTITPHVAADSDPDAIARSVAEQIRVFERGGGLANVVDPVRGY